MADQEVWKFPKRQNLSDHAHERLRCAENDPNRCQSVHSQSGEQCTYLSMPNTTYCPVHAPVFNRETANTGLYNLKRTSVLNRLEQMKKNPEGKSLVVELGILRLTLEELLNKCGDDQWAFAMNQGPITNLIQTIQSTLIANMKVEKHIGELLSIEQVLVLAQELYNIVTKYVVDPTVLGSIALDFEAVLKNPPKPELSTDSSKSSANEV